tara:strand:+ start:1439 stop:2407 length:969 start_codon:yes stop_codon:yes gene_type:complete
MKKINKILLELYNDRKQLLFLSFLACIDLIINNFIPSNPNIIQASATIATLAVTAIGTGYSIYSAEKNRSNAEELADEAETRRLAEQEKLDEAKAKYEKLEFTNPYKDIQTDFEFENPYEDLTVNQQEARFQAQQAAQQRTNIMTTLKGAAGGSGIAALAQSLANQGILATQKISASIGKQEAANQRLAAQGAARADQLEAQLEQRAQQLIGSGDQFVQQQYANKEATLLGMQMGGAAAANQEYQNALANQDLINAQADAQIASSLTNLATTAIEADYSGLKTDTTTNNFTGGDDMPANPSIGDFAEIGGVMKQWDGSTWVE